MPSRKLIEAMSFFASASVLVEGVGSKEESRKVNVNAFHSSATSLSVISFVQLQLIQCKLASNLCTLCTFYYTLQSRPLLRRGLRIPKGMSQSLVRACFHLKLWDWLCLV